MFVIPPFVETYYRASDENPWSDIWIGFSDNGGITSRLSDVMSLPEAGVIFQEMKSCENYAHGRSAFLTARLWTFSP